MTDKMIEEMARVIFERGVALDGTDFVFGLNGSDHFERIATAIYNAGYRKIPEGSVVLSKEEYEKLKADYEAICYNFDEIQRLWKTTNDRLGQCHIAYNITKDEKERLRENLQQALKETAREIFRFVLNMSRFDFNGELIFPVNLLRNEIKKQFGVEVVEWQNLN